MNYQSFSKAQGVSTPPPYNKSNRDNTQPGSNTTMNYQALSTQGISTPSPYNKSNRGNTLIQQGSNTTMNYQSLSAQGVSTPPPSTTTVRHQSMFIDPHFDSRRAGYPPASPSPSHTSMTGSPHFDYRRLGYPQGSLSPSHTSMMDSLHFDYRRLGYPPDSSSPSHTSLTGSLRFDPRVPGYPPKSPPCTSNLNGASQFDKNSDYLFDNEMEAEGAKILGIEEDNKDKPVSREAYLNQKHRADLLQIGIEALQDQNLVLKEANDSPDLTADYFALKQTHEESERCNATLGRQFDVFKGKYEREKAENTRLKARIAQLEEQLGA